MARSWMIDLVFVMQRINPSAQGAGRCSGGDGHTLGHRSILSFEAVEPTVPEGPGEIH
jgi:hypothetical protein